MILKKHINKFLYSIFPSRPVGRTTVFFSFLTILCVVFILWNATRTGEQSGNLSSSITENIKDNVFLIGIRIEYEKYINDFKIFLEEIKNDKVILNIIEDEELIKVVVNAYLLDKI